jgi:hypothetical protein
MIQIATDLIAGLIEAWFIERRKKAPTGSGSDRIDAR